MSGFLQLQVLALTALAMFFGGLIGVERELAKKPAGLRTHMLVAGASALLVGLVRVIIPSIEIGDNLIRADPIRIIEAVVTGITFLGAGTIIREEDEVEGLTTAASLLLVAALGIAVALEQYLLAAGATLLNFLVLRGVKRAEAQLRRWTKE